MTEIAAETDRRQTVAHDVKLVGLVSAAHGLSHFYGLVLPPILPLLTGAFGVGYTEFGLLMALMYVASGLMQTPAGMLVDRLGPAPVLIGWVAAPAGVLGLTALFGWRAALVILGGAGLLFTLYLVSQRAVLSEVQAG